MSEVTVAKDGETYHEGGAAAATLVETDDGPVTRETRAAATLVETDDGPETRETRINVVFKGVLAEMVQTLATSSGASLPDVVRWCVSVGYDTQQFLDNDGLVLVAIDREAEPKVARCAAQSGVAVRRLAFPRLY